MNVLTLYNANVQKKIEFEKTSEFTLKYDSIFY